MFININQEDVLNLINAAYRIKETLTTDYEPLELLTLNSIINQFIDVTPCKECKDYTSYKSGIRYTQDCDVWRNGVCKYLNPNGNIVT